MKWVQYRTLVWRKGVTEKFEMHQQKSDNY